MEKIATACVWFSAETETQSIIVVTSEGQITRFCTVATIVITNPQLYECADHDLVYEFLTWLQDLQVFKLLVISIELGRAKI